MVSITHWKSRNVHHVDCYKVRQETQAGVSLGGRRLLLPVFAAGARCLVQSQALKPTKKKVAQDHEERV